MTGRTSRSKNMSEENDMVTLSKANTNFLIDKSFWAAIIGVLVVFLNKKLGLNLDTTELVGILSTLAVYIAGNKWKSGTITVNEIQAQSDLRRVELVNQYKKNEEKLLAKIKELGGEV